MAGYKGLAGYAARGIAVLGLLTGCTMPGNVTPTPTEQSRLEQTVEASATAQPTTAPTDTPYFTDTPTPTPTPTLEAAGGPFELVVNYADIAQCSLMPDPERENVYTLGDDCYEGNPSLVSRLGSPAGGPINLEIINPKDGLALFELENGADVFGDYALCGSPSFNSPGSYDCEVGARFDDGTELIISIPVNIYKADATEEAGGNGGNGDDNKHPCEPYPDCLFSSPTPGT